MMFNIETDHETLIEYERVMGLNEDVLPEHPDRRG